MGDYHSETKSDNENRPEFNAVDSNSIIEQLRGKTEEVDYDQILKKTLGGYTKQSVLEYLGILRKQQQTTAATFSRNMQVLYDEKEALKKNNEKLLARLNSMESKYESLSDSIQLFEFENKEFSIEDVLALRNQVAVLEGEIKKNQYEMGNLQNKLDQTEIANQDLLKQLEIVNQEIENHKQLILAEKIETKKQRDTVLDTCRQLEAEIDKNRYLSELLNNGELTQAKAKVNDLVEQLALLNNVNVKFISEIQTKDINIGTQNKQIDSLTQRVNSLSATLEEISEQNDKLFAANQALTDQLLEEYKKSIVLVKERSNIIMEKLTINNKLNDANTKISIMEQLIDSEKRIDELRKLYTDKNELEYETEDSQE